MIPAAVGLLLIAAVDHPSHHPPAVAHAPALPDQPTRLPSSCFSAPGACGYPDPGRANVGTLEPCSELTPSGAITSAYDGQTIQSLNVIGTITVKNRDVTITNVCVTTNGGGQLGSAAISVLDGASNTLIENTTVAGADASADSVEIAAKNWSGQPATLSHDYFHDCGECIHDGPWTVNDSYVIADGMRGTGDHHEASYFDSGVRQNFNHDTLLNPENESAVIFGDNTRGGPCASHLTIANSLLAGGGEVIVSCGGDKSRSVGTSTTRITGNRIARCRTLPVLQTRDGGYACAGNRSSALGAGADSHGYWPRGGHYFLADEPFCPPTRGQVWAANVWDDDGAGIPC